MTESVREELCPDCGRVKATTVNSILRGDCPKWYAINDPDADIDCRMEKQRIEILKAFPPMKGDPLSQLSGLRAVRECDNCEGTGRVQPMLALYDGKCPLCTNGLRSREIPISEAVEILRHWANPDAIREYYHSQNNGEIYILLPSGERAEVG